MNSLVLELKSKENNKLEFETQLNSIDLYSYDYINRILLLCELLESLTVPDSIEYTLQYWSDDNDISTTIGDLMCSFCDHKLIKKLVTMFNVDASEILESQVNNMNIQTIRTFTNNFQYIYPNSDRLLSDILGEKYVFFKIANTPTWLIQGTDDDLLAIKNWKKLTDYVFKEPTPLFDDEFQNHLCAHIMHSLTDVELLNSHPKIDKYFGPLNGKYGCPSSVTGDGCRMLTCTCMEECDEDYMINVQSDSWFTGECDSCQKKILDLSHCIRFPLQHGGWKNNYCSIECMFTDPPYVVDDNYKKIIEVNLDCIKTYGILDRIF